MGYRHIMISQICHTNEDDLPQWFTNKYNKVIDFNGGYWKTTGEYKRYGILKDIEKDIQHLLNSGDLSREDSFELVFFADEGILVRGKIDVSHVLITKDEIRETFVGE